jgi:hypothetical protein
MLSSPCSPSRGFSTGTTGYSRAATPPWGKDADVPHSARAPVRARRFRGPVHRAGNWRGGITQLSPKRGVSLGDDGAGWSHNVATVTPGVPGDSGSAFLDANGGALGVLSTLPFG